MELNNAQDNDFGRVVEIYNMSIPSRLSTADTTLATVESKREWLESHSERRPLYVVKLQNVIVDWASFQSFYGRPAYYATVELSIYIDPVHQNKGVIMVYVGRWRIAETSAWDTEYLDEQEEACVEFTKESGTMTFGYVHIEMDVVKEKIGGTEILGYSFAGNDENDEVYGWGWFHQTQNKDEMKGKIYFRYGESSEIKMARYKNVC